MSIGIYGSGEAILEKSQEEEETPSDGDWFSDEGERQDTPPIVKDNPEFYADGTHTPTPEMWQKWYAHKSNKERTIEAEENFLPHTHEQVLQNLAEKGENRNFLESEAIKHGVDFDADTKDEYNRE